MMKVIAPGKLILSGEHAVVYGKPALAMAINRYATATITREVLPHIALHLTDLAHDSRFSLGSLRLLKDRIKWKYQRFIRGEYSIRQVLHKPFELAQVALGIFADALNLALPHGMKIYLQSDIPIGCGMGSSAATILCVMQAMSQYFNIPLSNDALFQLALEAENMQHGHSSGLDVRVAIEGGCLYIHGQSIINRSLPALPFYLINTGTPLSSTGECVSHASVYLKSGPLTDEFAAVTNAMDEALQQQSEPHMKASIRQNHRLLTMIGVVPDKIQQLIADIEMIEGAAKICGAGAICGENAGAVLAMVEDKTLLDRLCHRYGYHAQAVSGVSRGVYVL